MIKVENIETSGWEAAFRGMRNPLNSWDRSDSTPAFLSEDNQFHIGKNDFDLATRLIKAGSEHRKFLRMIHVSMDITAPTYWVSEHDTYKVGTTRNSCSFMHKGISKPFEIEDFSVEDERIYEILTFSTKEKIYPLVYPYETDKYKIYTLSNGREYKVYKNGRIVSCAFDKIDIMNRTRHFEEKEIKPSKTKGGYYEINIGGRDGEKWLLHRLVAHVWIPNNENLETVNHVNTNKGDNSVENLEWCTRQDNIKKAYEDGIYTYNLKTAYTSWKNGHTVVDPLTKNNIIKDFNNGLARKEIKDKYDLSMSNIYNILNTPSCENNELFLNCYDWENTLNTLNQLRDEYLETKDENIFQTIRKKLPSGYNIRYTWDANFETILNMIHQRENHRLSEWRQFVQAMFDNVPYCKEFYEAMYGKEFTQKESNNV